MTRLILLELNEINFDAIEFYISRGRLPTFAKLIRTHGYSLTTSEAQYEYIEPWIQWVTAHTGKSLAEHGIFRLGDIANHDIPQIWEQLEARGIRVGALSPMNAKNRTTKPAYFVPDPWTNTPISGPFLLRKMYSAISKAVSDNASGKLQLKSLMWLLAGALRFARPANYARYVTYALRSRSALWLKSMVLDLLLCDVFIRLTKQTKPDFTSLFLNAGAHIQHHYLFNSPAYANTNRNPEWYVTDKLDPLLELYELYDALTAQIVKAFPAARVLLATGLHQDPHPTITYYWRLANHAAFLTKLGVPHSSVEPRMSRDFLIRCSSTADAERATKILVQVTDSSGVPVFEADNRGLDIFVMLTYPNDIGADTLLRAGSHTIRNFRKDVVFVAIKNGQHNGTGYYLDTAMRAPSVRPVFSLTELPDKIIAALAPSQTPRYLP